ncbi:ADP-ribose pyrophosphatase [Labilithrix luteola]|uniref:GDP-mannose pyrophosphatase n=2 Tax=Labilithrix luteola TaxID=1391654 RepID=A0A0K1Q7B4_9BACT|nr:ADP-ribose pyrophosphatase [Labilithrix luteola]
MTPVALELPAVELSVVREELANADGFLRVRRVELVAKHEGETSSRFTYEVLDRTALDASIIVAHHEVDGVEHVWLLSSIRPPLALRPIEPRVSAVLWELPAGLVEPGEPPREGARRELEEELGFAVRTEELEPLGGYTIPAPGFVGELHHIFHVRVDPRTRREPTGDGSVLESYARIVSMPLARALEACRLGEIRDAKTELALRRLADLLHHG